MADAITATGLVKRYKTVTALDGVDLAVPTGSVLGLLGPNGAGKTTIVRILTTLLRPDEGSATVAGVDVLARPRDVRRRSRERARELLASFRLEDAADRPSKTYSGGMRRRLDLAGALVADPPIIFLDEPTTGLDPRGRTEMWEVIQNLVAGGTTLLLTTQYLEEADLLADDIVVIDHGKIIAQGTADQLKMQVGGERLELTVRDPATLHAARDLLEPLGVGKAGLDEGRRTLLMPITGGAQVLTEALRVLDDAGIGIDDVGLRRPTLDDVFLSLTGHASEEDTPPPDTPEPASTHAGRHAATDESSTGGA